jgi:hypothetical protein
MQLTPGVRPPSTGLPTSKSFCAPVLTCSSVRTFLGGGGHSKKEDEGEQQLYDRKLLTAVCAQMAPQHLAKVLKYPFCTGEAEQIVLNQSEAKTGRDFAGSVWKFVEQADALGIKDISSPAQRPSAQAALNELDKL